MGVRVVHRQIDSPQDCDYVHVRTAADPNDDTVTLATIKRITERAVDAEKSPTTRVKMLVEGQPMSPDSAVGLAKRYAERKHIPVVYAESGEKEDTATVESITAEAIEEQENAAIADGKR